MNNVDLDQLAINTIRTLSIDAIQQANSGHPGAPMALAPLVYTIWNRVMNFDPKDPIWPNRDRFVLSNGHASMLTWSILHLTGVQAVNADYERVGHASVTLDDIKHFRQLGGAPGHPEYHLRSGVEVTTGPLGQGIANSVGMAIARKWLADRYNRPGFELFDYNMYVVCGDGCLMEGVGSEAASLGRASRSRRPVLDLRQQSHHPRCPDERYVHRRRCGALPRLWLECAAGRRRQRYRAYRARAERISRDQGTADADHSRQPYRLWLAAQSRYPGGTWRTAR